MTYVHEECTTGLLLELYLITDDPQMPHLQAITKEIAKCVCIEKPLVSVRIKCNMKRVNLGINRVVLYGKHYDIIIKKNTTNWSLIWKINKITFLDMLVSDISTFLMTQFLSISEFVHLSNGLIFLFVFVLQNCPSRRKESHLLRALYTVKTVDGFVLEV